MSIQLEAWHIISLAVSLAGANAAAIRWGRDRESKALDARLQGLESAIGQRLEAIEAGRAREAENWRGVERELLKMKADMPLHYVRREDYIRGQSVIEAKLDALGSKLEVVQMGTAAFLNTQGGSLR